jgi:hypothetical protein
MTNVNANVDANGTVNVHEDFISDELVRFKASKSRIMNLSRDKFKVNVTRNVRDDGAVGDLSPYDPKNPKLASLAEHMKLVGWDPGSFVVAHDEGDGTYDLLKGNRRWHAAGLAGIEILPTIVLGGLTEAQKQAIILDHGHEEPIGNVGLYKSVKMCMALGLGVKKTAIKLGQVDKKTGKPRTNLINQYVALSKMPQWVQDQWFLFEREGKDAKGLEINPTLDNIKVLRAKQVEDEGNQFWSGTGPAFMEELNKLKETGVSSKTEKNKTALNNSGIVTLGQQTTEPHVRELLLGIAGVPKMDHNRALKEVVAACIAVYGLPKLPEPAAPIEPSVEEVFRGPTIHSEGGTVVEHSVN